MKAYDAVFHYQHEFWKEEKFFGAIRLFQLGDIQCRSGCVITEHTQSCFEVTCVSAGRGFCALNGREMELKKGVINIALKNDQHMIVTNDKKPLRYFFLAFDLLPSHPFYRQFDAFQRKFLEDLGWNQRDRFNLADIFVRCLAEFPGRGEFSDMIIESCLNQIVYYVFQIFDLQQYGYRPKFENAQRFVYGIIKFVEENIMNIESVDDVFRIFNYSASHVSHVFSRVMHKSLARYIADCRLEKARFMMEDENRSVTEVAEIFGYSSIHSFSRAFKNKFNNSPQAFIRYRACRDSNLLCRGE
jgi:AraC-like DNA-binding protein